MIEKAIQKYLLKNKYKKLNPKAVLFDMDGVLYDSMKFHSKAWKETSDQMGLNATQEEFYLYEGCTGAYTINKLFLRSYGREATKDEIEKIYQIKADLFRTYNDGEAMPGAENVLKQTQAFHLQTSVVTGSGQKTLIDKLEHTYPGYFTKEKMVTAYDVKLGKPNPEPYLMGLSKNEVAPYEAFVIENAPMGVQAGVAANIFTIAVNTGPLPDNVLLEAGANLLYPNMQALADDFKNIVNTCRNL